MCAPVEGRIRRGKEGAALPAVLPPGCAVPPWTRRNSCSLLVSFPAVKQADMQVSRELQVLNASSSAQQSVSPRNNAHKGVSGELPLGESAGSCALSQGGAAGTAGVCRAGSAPMSSMLLFRSSVEGKSVHLGQKRDFLPF